MIPFFDTVFTKEMEDAAIHALYNEKYVMGESVYKFEEELAKKGVIPMWKIDHEKIEKLFDKPIAKRKFKDIKRTD